MEGTLDFESVDLGGSFFSKFQISAGRKSFGVALNEIQKIFGPAQNIFGHVEGQGINMATLNCIKKSFQKTKL